MRRAAKVDVNHSAIVKAFRDLGCSVLDLSRMGQGCPDLLIGKHQRNRLVEVKRDKKAKLTDAQLEFFGAWKGHVSVVTSPDDAARVVGLMDMERDTELRAMKLMQIIKKPASEEQEPSSYQKGYET